MAESETRSSGDGGQSQAEGLLPVTEQIRCLLTSLDQIQNIATGNNARTTSSNPSPTKMILVSSIDHWGEGQYEQRFLVGFPFEPYPDRTQRDHQQGTRKYMGANRLVIGRNTWCHQDAEVQYVTAK